MPFTTNLIASLSSYRFSMVLGTPTRAAGSGVVSIPFTAYGPASGSNTIIVLEYSVNGASWVTATPETPSQLSNVTFSVDGTGGVVSWLAFEDLGQTLFNNTLYLRIRATDGTFVTPITTVTFTIEKIVTTADQRTLTVFPNNYKGVSGSKVAEILKSISS